MSKNLLSLGWKMLSSVDDSQKVQKVTHIFTVLRATMTENVAFKN